MIPDANTPISSALSGSRTNPAPRCVETAPVLGFSIIDDADASL